MSTFLVCVVVVAAATVLVVRIALSDPDQPATPGWRTRRGPERVDGRPPLAAASADQPVAEVPRGDTGIPVDVGVGDHEGGVPDDGEAFRPGLGPGDGSRRPRPVPTARRRRPPARRRAPRMGAGVWVRVRSALALVVLVAFVGGLVAMAVGMGLALAARALRHAVG
ncbi:MAG: hypothetical protein ABR511_14450 [Acidimicrobiales bacterium]